jgi:hypothetical protein
MASPHLSNNKSIQILKAAEEGGYGVPGVVSVLPLSSAIAIMPL